MVRARSTDKRGARAMTYYPVNLNLQGRGVLVVGGGSVAQGKTEQLIKAGARLLIVSPELTARLRELADLGIVRYRRGEFSQDDLQGVMLVISATDCHLTNQTVARAAAPRGPLRQT